MIRDKNGKISGKRIGGFLLIATGIFISVFITIADRSNLVAAVPIVSEFIVFGCALLGITLAERKDK